MVSQPSGNKVTLVAIIKMNNEGKIVYRFDINETLHSFEACTIGRDGIRGVEMSEPLERLLRRLLPVAPQIVRTLVEVTFAVMDGSNDALPVQIM